ncbi:hypothetical protein GIB67_009023 [Kingdonia uniflora]|uniref:Sey1/RHD3-like three-helix bundle domain-containing protein n=1 Tax=Kingdonia uniflora TaxID=39325 RepID=A0A7J7LVW6_9MAGN|nr:hypothetical protein GIB67_009023 [Kingdonia uniflora]
MLFGLENYARSVVETKAKEEARKVLIHMNERFSTLFSLDSDSMPRVWTGKEDIQAITKTVCAASLKLLYVFTALWLDEDADDIENILSVALLDTTSNAGCTDKSITRLTHWLQVVGMKPPPRRLNKRTGNWLPPPWAIFAILVLGFNEFMTLLRNLLYLDVVFMTFFLYKACWVQLDISCEFRKGALPGLLSLSMKFPPTLMNLLRKLADEELRPATTDPQRNLTFQSTVQETETKGLQQLILKKTYLSDQQFRKQ